jgi:hypothetical protein
LRYLFPIQQSYNQIRRAADLHHCRIEKHRNIKIQEFYRFSGAKQGIVKHTQTIGMVIWIKGRKSASEPTHLILNLGWCDYSKFLWNGGIRIRRQSIGKKS